MLRETMTRRLGLFILFCLITVVAWPLSAQRSDQSYSARDRRIVTGDDDDQPAIDTTIPFNTSGGVVDLSIVSGEITVTGWSRGEARVHVTSDDEDQPVHFEHSADRILLDAGHG